LLPLLATLSQVWCSYFILFLCTIHSSSKTQFCVLCPVKSMLSGGGSLVGVHFFRGSSDWALPKNCHGNYSCECPIECAFAFILWIVDCCPDFLFRSVNSATFEMSISSLSDDRHLAPVVRSFVVSNEGTRVFASRNRCYVFFIDFIVFVCSLTRWRVG